VQQHLQKIGGFVVKPACRAGEALCPALRDFVVADSFELPCLACRQGNRQLLVTANHFL